MKRNAKRFLGLLDEEQQVVFENLGKLADSVSF
jgi:hypothetical protein